MALPANIGSINVSITASVDKFNKGIDSARSKLGGFVNSLTKGLGAVTGFTGALTGAGLVYGLKQTFNEIEKIGKAANRLGVSTKTVQTLTIFADEAGVSFGAMAKAVQTAGIAVDKALGGDKSKAGAFGILGLDPRTLRGAAPEQQLARIADGIAKLRSQSEKATVATQLFGKAGLQMLSVFKDGSGELLDAADRAAKFGANLDAGMVKQVEAANDAIENLGMSIKKLFVAVAAELAPLINSTANLIQQISKIPHAATAASAAAAATAAAKLAGQASPRAEQIGGFFGLGYYAGEKLEQWLGVGTRAGRAAFGLTAGAANVNSPENTQMWMDRARASAGITDSGSATQPSLIQRQMAETERHNAMIAAARARGRALGRQQRFTRDTARALFGGIASSNVGRTAFDIAGMAGSGFNAARLGLANFQWATLPALANAMATRQGGSPATPGYRGLALADPLSREGFSQRVRAQGVLAQSNIAKQSLAVQERIEKNTREMAKNGVVLAAANLGAG